MLKYTFPSIDETVYAVRPDELTLENGLLMSDRGGIAVLLEIGFESESVK
jgi:hypothetical protein